LLGKGEKSDFNTPVNSLPIGPLGLVSLERKPLPGIQISGNQSKLTKSWTALSSNVEEHKEIGRDKELEKEKIVDKSGDNSFVKEDFGLGTSEKEVSYFHLSVIYVSHHTSIILFTVILNQ
jgi:hypothetical protein